MPLTVALSGNMFRDCDLELFNYIGKDSRERARKFLLDNIDVVWEI